MVLRKTLYLLGLCGAVGCIRAPNTLYMVDSQTAVEEQAAGSYRPLEVALEAPLLIGGPLPVTRNALALPGGEASSQAAALGPLYRAEADDAQHLDALLIRRCVGEAWTGELVATPARCQGALDEQELIRLVQRVNRNRHQIWSYLAARRDQPEALVQAAWRKRHLERVVCGAQVQQEDGAWKLKSC